MLKAVLRYCNVVNPVLGDLLVVGFGLLVSLGFAPFAYRVAPFLAIAALLLLLETISVKRALLRGFLFGLGMFGLGVSWIFNSLYDFGSASWFIAASLAACMVIVNACIIAGLSYIFRRWLLLSYSLRYVLVFPALWVLNEWLRSWLLTGFPWLYIAYSQVDTLLGLYAPVGGVFLVSMLTAVIAGALALFFVGGSRDRWLAGLVIVGVLLISLGLRLVQWTEAIGKPVTVALVQGAISQELRMQPDKLSLSQQRYDEMTQAYLDRDLIIWPETAIPAFAHWVEPYFDYINQQLLENDAQLLTGIFIRDAEYRLYYNSLLKLGDDEQQAYYKRRLVPFGEYMPFRGLLEFMGRYVDIPMSDITIGKSMPIMILAGYPVAIGICYESAYPEIYRAQLPQGAYMINVSNDAWFGDSLAPHQHLEIAQIRALEAGRYMLRATNTGISAIIDPAGRIIARSQQFQSEVLSGEFQPMQGATPFIRFGSWPVLMLSLILVVLGVLRARKISPNFS